MTPNGSPKRRDTKNRILHTGESQQKNGRYVYKYIDHLGKPKFIYSWKLVATDRIPAGKRDCLSLRDKEKELQKDLDDGIDHVGKNMTVCQLYEKQIRYRANVRVGTERNRAQLVRILQEDSFGSCRIGEVRISDAKEWVIRMKAKGYAFTTISNHKRSLKAAFFTAIQDDYIRKNPFDFSLNTVLVNDTTAKEALCPAQEEVLLDFMRTSNVYRKHLDEVIILLGTGLRVSELCGLTVSDIDLTNRRINVTHQLLKEKGGTYYIAPPKTKSGIRQIPMSRKVQEALNRVMASRMKTPSVTIDGYHDFLFLSRNGVPKVSAHYDGLFRGLMRSFRKHCDRELPRVVTPHTMRHTFCTNMANAGMNPKALQYLMGHANITMTLNYYAHATSESAEAEMRRLLD